MSSDKIKSVLQLDYHQKRFTYNIDWKIPSQVGSENFVMEYSKLFNKNELRSEKIFCTNGPFQGAGKYFYREFYLAVRPDILEADLFVRMCYTKVSGRDKDFEKFEFGNVSCLLYDLGSTEHRQDLEIFSRIQLFESTIPLLEQLDSGKEEEDSIKKWFPNGFRIRLANRITQITLCLEIQHWWKPSPFELEDPIIPASTFLPKKCKLKTKDLLFSPNFSDVTIFCGDRQFSAHALIPKNASSALCTMFSHSMVESLTREVTIKDAEPEIVEEFLRYIYTGTVTNMAKNSVDLLVIADKYDVQNLKSLCEGFILTNISDENVLECYNIGKLLKSEAITSKCAQEIRKNKKSIWKTKDEFCEASQKFPELFYEIFYN